MKEATIKVNKHDALVAGMFGNIARFYDFLNHLLSLGIDLYWRRELAFCVKAKAGDRVLDLAAGTLDVALALRRLYPSITVPAFDFCPPMLKLGLNKLKGPNKQAILPVAACAKHLPLASESVEAITIAFGIRNILPRAEALYEMHRVLKKGGRLCILEFGSGQERILGGLYNFYLNRLLPLLGKFFSKDEEAYSYLARTICAFPKAEQFQKELRECGFVNTSFRPLTFGIVCLHLAEKS